MLLALPNLQISKLCGSDDLAMHRDPTSVQADKAEVTGSGSKVMWGCNMHAGPPQWSCMHIAAMAAALTLCWIGPATLYHSPNPNPRPRHSVESF